MIEATRTIDDTGDVLAWLNRSRSFDHMINDACFILVNIDYRSFIENARVIRLPAAGRIKCGCLKHDAIPALERRDTEYGGLKFEQTGVTEVKSCSWLHKFAERNDPRT